MIRGFNDTHVGTGWMENHLEMLVTHFGKYFNILLGAAKNPH
jgi:hypothetical protein